MEEVCGEILKFRAFRAGGVGIWGSGFTWTSNLTNSRPHMSGGPGRDK